ncbi:MAG: LysM peptidoglycan-binding domain-containing protein, partial [Rhizobium sp.]
MGISLSSNFGKSAGKVLVAILLASTATACSSDTTRFSGLFSSRTDNVTTGSINRRSLNGPDGDPVPRADIAQAGGYGRQDYSQQSAPVSQPYPNSPARYNPSYSSARASAGPVAIQRTELAPPNASASASRPRAAARAEAEAMAQPFPASRNNNGSRAAPALAPDNLSTGTIKTASAPQMSSGWTTVNAPSVTLHPGENIALLSRRYGVPEKEILRANGLRNGAGAQPGQQIIIPTMNGAGASSPAKMASEATDLSKGGKMPGPAKAPQQDALALPSGNQMRGKSQAGLADPNKLAAGNGKGPTPKGTYVVKPGDSLARIAKQSGVTVAELKRANNMQAGESIRIGQALTLPHGGTGAAAADPVKTASIEPQKVSAKPAALPVAEPKQAAAEPAAKQAAPKAVARADAAADTAAKPQVVASASPSQSINDAAKSDAQADAPEATGIGKYRWPV